MKQNPSQSLEGAARSRRLAAATLALAACAVAQAQPTAVTIGGTVDVGLRQVRNAGVGTVQSQVSGANATSKLIVRGQENLGGGLNAGFFLDATILADSGGAGASAPAGQFWDRRSTVSLSHTSYGELRMGRDWVPTHLVWTAMDPFTTLGIASANTFRSFTAARVLGQAFGTAPESQAANPTLRVSNAVEYFLPAGLLGGLYGQLIVTAGEGGTTAAGGTRGDGFRLGWAQGALNVGGAQFTTRNANGNQRFQDRVLGASYDFGVVRVSLAQRRWTYLSDRTVHTLMGATVPVGPGVIKLSWLQADQSGATAARSANDANLLGIGYVHALSKRTALYAHAARLANRGAATFTIPGGPAVSSNPAAGNYFGGERSTGYELGLRHDF